MAATLRASSTVGPTGTHWNSTGTLVNARELGRRPAFRPALFRVPALGFPVRVEDLLDCQTWDEPHHQRPMSLIDTLGAPSIDGVLLDRLARCSRLSRNMRGPTRRFDDLVNGKHECTVVQFIWTLQAAKLDPHRGGCGVGYASFIEGHQWRNQNTGQSGSIEHCWPKA